MYFNFFSKKIYLLAILPLLVGFCHGNVHAQKSEAYYELLVESQQKARDLNNAGFKAMYAKQYKEALLLFNEAIELDTLQSHYFANRGHVKKALQDWAGAVKDYEVANIIDPKITHETYFQSGEIYQKHLKNYEKAIEAYSQAVSVVQHNEDYLDFHLIYFNRGNTFMKMGKLKKAIQDYDETIRLFNEYGNAYLNRGVAKFNLKQQKQACEDWEKAVEFGANGGNVYLGKYCK